MCIGVKCTYLMMTISFSHKQGQIYNDLNFFQWPYHMAPDYNYQFFKMISCFEAFQKPHANKEQFFYFLHKIMLLQMYGMPHVSYIGTNFF
jgi:hypothetical protein